jgi:uncharacterized protein YqjF (DUF2071 family)
MARLWYALPYYRAEMRVESEGDEVRYRSRRAAAEGAEFAARYRPLGGARAAAPGTLDYFLTERYCLYALRGRRVDRAEIHHLPWPLEAAEAEVESNSMLRGSGMERLLPPAPALAQYARRLKVLVWAPERAGP